MSKQLTEMLGDQTRKNMDDQLVKIVASRIVTHLLKNPSKKDTLRGICEWWLLQERIDYTINIVSIALELLLSKEFINEKTIAGVEKIYQLNKEKYNDLLKVSDWEKEVLTKTNEIDLNNCQL